MQSAEFLTIFVEKFVCSKKKCYLCSRFGCKGASVRARVCTRIIGSNLRRLLYGEG